MSFTSLSPEDIQISTDSIVSTLWSNNKPVLNNIFKKNIETTSYLPVYESNPNIILDAEPQFNISYGNIYGSGSAPINPSIIGLSPTKITYGQIRTLINGDENKKINFGIGNNEADDFFLINIERSRYKEKLFLSTFNLRLTNNSGSIDLTNNSNDLINVEYCDAGRIYDIVKGNNGNSIPENNITISGSYGKFLPDVGLILLNPKALSLPFVSGGLDINIDYNNTNISNNNNNNNLFNLINDGGYFSLNSEESITSSYIFTRVRNNDYNYTTNPSIINNEGEFNYSNFISNPQTFITTIGLYNDANELLAVSKLSKPLKKDFTKEALFRIKLQF